MHTTLCGIGKPVTIGSGLPTVIIGERINPTGNKRLAAALVAGDLDLVREMARAQVAAGWSWVGKETTLPPHDWKGDLDLQDL